MKTIIYIDGFNLYYGVLRGTPFKWLNPLSFIQSQLASRHEIVRVKYFTAKVIDRQRDPEALMQQELYLRALRTLPNLEIILGHFLTHKVKMLLADDVQEQSRFVQVIKTEEKGTDVNLATQLVHDAHLNRMDCAVIVSGDSDFLSPVRITTEEIGKIVGVINPQEYASSALKKHATFYKHIKRNYLFKHQFPSKMCDLKGSFSKPVNW